MRIAALALALLLVTALHAQSPALRGGVQQNERIPLADIYRSQDPTKGRPQIMPPASTPGGYQCVAPVRGWILVARIGNRCYYFAPYANPAPAYVVPVSQAGRVRGRCGAHPWDPAFVLCDSPSPALSPAPNSHGAPPVDGGFHPLEPQHAPLRPNPVQDTFDYTYGLALGASDCIKGFHDMFAGAALFSDGDFAGAAKAWGIEPGQSATLRELSTKRVGRGVSPLDAGRVDGRRICGYAVVPGTLKAAKTAVATKLRGAGATSEIPLSTAETYRATSSQAFAPLIAGKWIPTSRGPVQLGKYIGKGAMAAMYEDPLNPGQVLKVSNGTIEGKLSIPRQFEHAGRLERARVPAVKVHEHIPGGPNHPGVLRMDHVNKQWPTAKRFEPGEWSKIETHQRTPYELAIQDAGRKIGGAGLVANDLHSGNFGFVPTRNGFLGIIIDHDMTWTIPEFLDHLDSPSGQNVKTILRKGGYDPYSMPAPNSAAAWMDAIFNSRFGYSSVRQSQSGTPLAK